MVLLRLMVVGCLMALLGGAAAHAQQQSTSPKVEELLQLLGDKDVRDWLEAHKAQAPPTAESAATVDSGAVLSNRLREIRQHLSNIAQAVPQAPAEIERAAVRLRAATEGYRFVTLVLLAGSFVLVGLAAEWLFQRAAQGFGAGSPQTPALPPAQRIKALLHELIVRIGGVAAFAIGSLGAFLLFPWPDLLRTIVVTLLVAALTIMIARNLLAILFGPSRGDPGAGSTDHGLLVMSPAAATHFRRMLLLAIAWFAIGHAFVQVLRLVDVHTDVVAFVAYVLGLGLLAIGLWAVWRRPTALTGHDADRAAAGWSWFYSLILTSLWVLWVAGAMRLFWLVAVAIGLPLAITWTRRAVHTLLRATGTVEGELPKATMAAVAAEYIVRALLILSGIWILAWAWGVGLHSFAASDDALTRAGRAVLSMLIILLVSDLVWQLLKTLIDTFLSKAADPSPPGSPQAIRSAKLQTLLPIARNVVMVFVVTLAILMALSTLGVQIGPLIASAGVVGLAIGFGAQTVVKDVISGMFYLMDDAFRVGEYIITGKFMGTVESFSLRSVRLRHHNGPVFTIPFGDLGAVQNMSRDYVIDKFRLTVTYESDLDKARKLIKKVGEQLMEDPDLEGMILEPMKMQRVDQFGDYGIVLKCKIKTRPGEQFMVRKKAFPMIKKLFDENGIGFAFPTVKVAEGAHDSKVVAAQQALTIAAGKQAAM